jgi:hypothetical protein
MPTREASRTLRPAGPSHPRGFGFAPGVLDWESYLGSLEEIGYSGFLTAWPDPAGDVRGQFLAIVKRLNQVG